MKKIGGIFPIGETMQKENHFFDTICPKNGDLKFLMSGRCSIYYALEDLKLNDTKRVAYVPLYTCETVIAPFKKAGYTLKFYSFSKDMTPIFDENVLDTISVISICGYYGFSRFDRNFVKKCKERNIAIIEDTTHSILSGDGIDENCDYVVGSLRKWMGITCGGFAIKCNSKFLIQPKTPDEYHLKLRTESIEKSDIDIFWKAEMQLRDIFDYYGSDNKSEYIMKHTDFQKICKKRRENYKYLLSHFRGNEKIKIVFPQLSDETVPSHFTLFVDERKKVQTYLSSLDIKTSVFWPQGPYIDLVGQEDTKYIYDHVMSVTCDQRFNTEDMQRICDALNSYCSNQ